MFLLFEEEKPRSYPLFASKALKFTKYLPKLLNTSTDKAETITILHYNNVCFLLQIALYRVVYR